jgi:hypothetical protein
VRHFSAAVRNVFVAVVVTVAARLVVGVGVASLHAHIRRRERLASRTVQKLSVIAALKAAVRGCFSTIFGGTWSFDDLVGAGED